MTGAKKLIDEIFIETGRINREIGRINREIGRFRTQFQCLGAYFRRPLAALDRCTLIKGAFAFKIVRGALKWPLKGGSRLIEVAATAGLTVHLSTEEAAKSMMLEPFGETGGDVPEYFSSRTHFAKIEDKKVSAKN